jgi:LacI family transcriptional regulator
MVTINDVAEICGVSIATVSRALNGSPEVGEETRRRILRLVAELDYTPSAAARTLVTRRSNLFGVVLDTGYDRPGLQHPFFQDVLVGLRDEASDLGFDLLLFARDRTATDLNASIMRRCRHHGVDGVVVIALDIADHNVASVSLAGIPFVALDVDVESGRAARIASDNAAGAALAVSHLHELGHTRIGMLTAPVETKPGRERLDGFNQEMAARGLGYPAEYVLSGDFSYASGVRAAGELLALPEPPTAIFASTDIMAAGVIRGMLDAGARVPDDLAVVGFDDLPLASMTEPSLTTVRQDGRGLGVAAAQALDGMLRDAEAPPPAIRMPVELIVRRSSTGHDPTTTEGKA